MKKYEVVHKLELKGIIKSKAYKRKGLDDGILFYNEKGENIGIGFDTKQQCCEDYDYDIPQALYENKILSMEGINITITEYDNEGTDTKGFQFIVKTQEGEAYHLYCENSHNGWYCHEVALAQDGKYIWTKWV